MPIATSNNLYILAIFLMLLQLFVFVLIAALKAWCHQLSVFIQSMVPIPT